jgi:hypothetical protein
LLRRAFHLIVIVHRRHYLHASCLIASESGTAAARQPRAVYVADIVAGGTRDRDALSMFGLLGTDT